MRLVLVDPVSGATVASLTPPELFAASAVVGGAAGVFYFSSELADGSTSVLALEVMTGERAEIGRVAAPALVQALAPTGDRLFLAAFSQGGGEPSALVAVPIPARWRPTPVPGPAASREAGPPGLISQDGRRWAHLSGLGEKGMLVLVEFAGDAPPVRINLRIPSPYNYYTLLAAPDDRTLYVVDYRNAMTIHVVDSLQRAVVHSVATREGGGTKGSSWSAILAPDGSRLYTIGTDAERGIDVLDTASLQRLGTLLAGQPIATLAISPDGRFLYATSFGEATPGTRLITIDSHTGNELQTVVLRPSAFAPLLATGPLSARQR